MNSTLSQEKPRLFSGTTGSWKKQLHSTYMHKELVLKILLLILITDVDFQCPKTSFLGRHFFSNAQKQHLSTHKNIFARRCVYLAKWGRLFLRAVSSQGLTIKQKDTSGQ